MKQIGAKRYWNLLVIFIVCDYGVEKTNFAKKNLKRYIYVALRAHCKPKCIWLGQKLLTLKLSPIPIPMLALSLVEF